VKAKILLSLSALFLAACIPELEDCDTKADLLKGAWIVKQVFIDGIEQDPKNYAAFRLTLQSDGHFQRQQPDGFPDSGSWLLDGETTLTLQPNISPAEPYVIALFNLRELVLELNRSSIKKGPSQIRYVLIPE
jgi:hypothetical protein